MSSLIEECRLRCIEKLVELTNHLPGDVVEIGVYKGGSLVRIAKAAPHKEVYGYDTFEGLPEPQWKSTEVHTPGEFAASQDEVVRLLGAHDIQNVRLIKGMYPQSETRRAVISKTTDFEVDWSQIGKESRPGLRTLLSYCRGPLIAFAHIDVDLEQGTKECLEFIWEFLVPGGIIVFDDYGWHKCPGVKRVVDKFVEDKKADWREIELYNAVPKQAWIRKGKL